MESSASTYRVVVGLDFSDLADRALLEAVRACRGHQHSELHALIVAADEEGLLSLPGRSHRALTQEEADALAKEHVAQLLKAHEDDLPASGLDRVAVYVAPGLAAERIVALAASIEADLIVVGTHGRNGLARWVLGSVAEEVVRKAPCGVLVIRPKDFLDGQKVPAIDPPLKPGEHSLKPFRHSATYHYLRREPTSRMMPSE